MFLRFDYLKGAAGNQLNTILAGTSFNLKKMLNIIKEQILFGLFQFINFYKFLFFQKLNLQNKCLFKV